MTELESVPSLKKAKRQAKPAAKKQRVLKVMAGVTVAAAAVGLSRRAFQNRWSIVIPDDFPKARTAVGIEASAHRKLIGIVRDSLLPAEVADMLATTATLLTKRIRARKLYAIPFADTWVFPKFQFHKKQLLRGIDDVLPCLDVRLHPLEVINWFALPNADLTMDGEALSPAAWLARGGDITRVADLAGEVGSGL